MSRRACRVAGLVWLAAVAAGCNDEDLNPYDPNVWTMLPFADVESDQVDVLWVIDSSGSMGDNQAALVEEFNTFVQELIATEADFHIAVITTDPVTERDAGVFRRGPDPATYPNLAARCEERIDPVLRAADYALDTAEGVEQLHADFECIATVGTFGSGFEAGLDAMRRALSPALIDHENAGFLRNEALLSVIFLTDEDDCSNGGSEPIVVDSGCYSGPTRERLTPVAEFYDFLVELKGEPERIVLGGIIGPDDFVPHPPQFGPGASSCGGPTGSARDGERYRELLDMFEDSVEAEICAADLTPPLRAIGAAIGGQFRSLCLPYLPAACETSADCPDGSDCIDPGNTGGARVCSGFEIEVQHTLPPGNIYVPLASPGIAATWSVPRPDREFDVDWDDLRCPSGVGVSIHRDARPPTGATLRWYYEIDSEPVNPPGYTTGTVIW